MLPFLNRALALAARALKFARSVPLRLGVTRVPRTCYGFCVRGAGGGDYPPGTLSRRLGFVAWSYARR